MDYLLTPPDDLQEAPLGNVDFSRFTDGSYLKGSSGKYCAGYAIANSVWCCWSSIFTYGYFSLTGWIIHPYMVLYFSQGQNWQYLY